jgi:membrane protease YdiL (CAAX protease family)
LNYDTFTGRRSAFVCTAFVLILLSFAAYSLLGQTLMKLLAPHMGKNMLTAVMLLIQNGLVVASVLIAALVPERNYPLKEKLGLNMDPEYSLRFFFPIFVLAIGSTYLAQWGLSALLEACGREAKEQALVEFYRTLKPLAFFGFALITVIAAPIAEELAFRHIMYRFVRVFLYRKEASVVVSLIFALCHVPAVIAYLFGAVKVSSGGWSAFFAGCPWEQLLVPMIPLFILAMFLQRQYEKSKSVIPSTLIHMGFNLIAVLLLILQVYYGAGE